MKKRWLQFESELSDLINRNGIDADLGGPDFIIAELLTNNLCALYNAKHEAQKFWDDKPRTARRKAKR